MRRFYLASMSIEMFSMKRSKNKILFFLLLLHGGMVYGGTSGILEGKVKDKSTKENLVSVTIQIVGTNFGSITNADGYYQIYNIRSGIYDVKFSLIGYKTVIMKNVSIYADLHSRLDVTMDQSSVELGAIEIFSQKPLIQKDQPSTSFSIGEIKLEKLPVTSFQEVISLQPGVTLEGNVRGGKTNEVMYLVDGLPVQDYMGGGVGMEIPKSSISGMTIYTGGFDAEYGNAMSGIVNVITKGGDNNYRFSLRFEKDNWLPSTINKQVDQYNEGELSLSGPIVTDKLFFLNSTTMIFHNTRWWQDMNKFFSSPNNREINGFSKIEYVATSSIRLTAQGIYSFRNWKDYEFSWRYNLNGLPERSKTSLRGSLILTHILSDRSAYTLNVTRYYLTSKIGRGDKNEMHIAPYQFDYYLRYIVDGMRNWWANSEQLLHSFKGDYSSQIDDAQMIKSGFELNLYDIYSDLIKYEPQKTYFGKTIENAPLLNYSNRYKYSPRSGSIFIEDKIRFALDGTVLNVGLRWDFLDPQAKRPIVEFIPTSTNEFQQQIKGYKSATIKHQFSPRIAFAAPTGPSSMVFVNFGKYFQFPLFDYLYSGIDPTLIQSGAKNILTGNPDLNPEVTTAWELGYKQSIGEFYVGSITYFQKNIKNQIDSKTLVPFDSKFAGDFGFAQYVNNAEADASGLEIVLSRDRDEQFSGSISYTYMIAEGTSELVDQTINRAQWGFPTQISTFPLSWDQRHAVKLDIESKLWFGIIFNGIVWYNSPKPYTFFPTKDGFTPIDSTKDFVPNNARMKQTFFVNLKFSKEFFFSNLPAKKIIVYADVRNLFNSQNVKWIDSNGKIGGELSDPSAYYDHRRVRVGFSVDF